jgi:hypothetical protein
MKSAPCYMPAWGPTGKLVKRGSYCCWEAVVAHVNYMAEKQELTAEEQSKIHAYITTMVGIAVRAAPSYEHLTHTGGTLTQYEFMEACTAQHDQVLAMRLGADGTVQEITLTPVGGRFDLNSSLSGHGPVSSFQSTRKHAKDRDMTVYFISDKELPPNTLASNLFKMQLYGEVLLVQHSRENCLLPRERFVHFTQAAYDEQFAKKRKREPHTLTKEEYGAVKGAMQEALNNFERSSSAAAVPPAQMSKSQKVAAPTGSMMAALAVEMGC